MNWHERVAFLASNDYLFIKMISSIAYLTSNQSSLFLKDLFSNWLKDNRFSILKIDDAIDINCC